MSMRLFDQRWNWTFARDTFAERSIIAQAHLLRQYAHRQVNSLSVSDHSRGQYSNIEKSRFSSD